MVTGLDLPSISTVSILAVVMGIVRWALHFFSLQSKMDGFDMASQNVLLRSLYFLPMFNVIVFPISLI